jgi:hypothetical protein
MNALWPAIETLALLLGAVGSFILAKIDVEIYETEPEKTWVGASPTAIRVRRPWLVRAGFGLLGFSFVVQILFVWLRWYRLM